MAISNKAQLKTDEHGVTAECKYPLKHKTDSDIVRELTKGLTPEDNIPVDQELEYEIILDSKKSLAIATCIITGKLPRAIPGCIEHNGCFLLKLASPIEAEILNSGLIIKVKFKYIEFPGTKSLNKCPSKNVSEGSQQAITGMFGLYRLYIPPSDTCSPSKSEYIEIFATDSEGCVKNNTYQWVFDDAFDSLCRLAGEKLQALNLFLLCRDEKDSNRISERLLSMCGIPLAPYARYKSQPSAIGVDVFEGEDEDSAHKLDMVPRDEISRHLSQCGKRISEDSEEGYGHLGKSCFEWKNEDGTVRQRSFLVYLRGCAKCFFIHQISLAKRNVKKMEVISVPHPYPDFYNLELLSELDENGIIVLTYSIIIADGAANSVSHQKVVFLGFHGDISEYPTDRLRGHTLFLLITPRNGMTLAESHVSLMPTLEKLKELKIKVQPVLLDVTQERYRPFLNSEDVYSHLKTHRPQVSSAGPIIPSTNDFKKLTKKAIERVKEGPPAYYKDFVDDSPTQSPNNCPPPTYTTYPVLKRGKATVIHYKQGTEAHDLAVWLNKAYLASDKVFKDHWWSNSISMEKGTSDHDRKSLFISKSEGLFEELSDSLENVKNQSNLIFESLEGETVDLSCDTGQELIRDLLENAKNSGTHGVGVSMLTICSYREFIGKQPDNADTARKVYHFLSELASEHNLSVNIIDQSDKGKLIEEKVKRAFVVIGISPIGTDGSDYPGGSLVRISKHTESLPSMFTSEFMIYREKARFIALKVDPNTGDPISMPQQKDRRKALLNIMLFRINRSLGEDKDSNAALMGLKPSQYKQLVLNGEKALEELNARNQGKVIKTQ